MTNTLAPALIAEFKHESTTTRRLLERVPEESFGWKPHVKSMSLRELAGHLANIAEWTPWVMDGPGIDFDAMDFEQPKVDSKTDLLALFDRGIGSFLSALEGREDAAFMEVWTMRKGDTVLNQMPRIAVLRGFILSHLIHHRGQLSVYLRQLDVPLPQIYGPSADDPGGF